MKKVCVFLICFCFCIIPVNALYCSYENLSYYKKIASNIQVSYDYEELDSGIVFTTTITNLQPNYYIVDNTTGNSYHYTGQDIVISGYRSGQSIQYTVYTTNANCEEEVLITIRLTMPTYNRYYKESVCEGVNDYSLCNRWSSHGLDHSTFIKKVNQYKADLNKKESLPMVEEIPDNSIVQWILRLVGEYYYVFLLGIIIISSIGIYKINKKDSMYY